MEDLVDFQIRTKMEQPNNYQKEFAEVYDELMTGSKYDKWDALLKELIDKYDIKSGNAIDLASGTGTITKMLLDMGFAVTGIDKSSDMLKIARKKLKDYGKRVNFVQADLTSFKLPQKYNLAVSFYDSINYLLDLEKIGMMFNNVYSSLELGGYVIFDTNTLEHMHMSQKNPVKEFSTKKGKAKFKFGGEGDFWSLEITLLNKKGEEYKEVHLERGYSPKQIKNIAEREGFDLLEIIDECKIYWDGKEHLNRQYYVLKKSEKQERAPSSR